MQRHSACGGTRRETGAGTRAHCAPVRRVHAPTTAIAIAKSPPNLYECTEVRAFVGPARRCVPGMRARFCWCQRPCGDAASRRRTPRSMGQPNRFSFEGARQSGLWRISNSKVARISRPGVPKITVLRVWGCVAGHHTTPDHPRPGPGPHRACGTTQAVVVRRRGRPVGHPGCYFPSSSTQHLATYGCQVADPCDHGRCLARLWPWGSCGGAGGAWGAVFGLRGRPRCLIHGFWPA